MTYPLRLEDVWFRYPRSGRDALRGITWAPGPGRTVLLGPNGAGKSTVLALAAGALRARAGRVDRVAGVGWMPQDVRAVAGLRVREQVAYAGWLQGMSRRLAWSSALQALDQVGLGARADDRTTSLSGGQVRRVGLAEVLVADPRLLLLDEPTAGLDPDQRVQFREILRGLPPGRRVVVSTHLVDDLGDLFDHVVVLSGGQLAYDGPVIDFLGPEGAGDGARRAEAAYRRALRSDP